jgi:hypothetical protein
MSAIAGAVEAAVALDLAQDVADGVEGRAVGAEEELAKVGAFAEQGLVAGQPAHEPDPCCLSHVADHVAEAAEAIAQAARRKNGLRPDPLTLCSMFCTMMKLGETELVEDPDGNSIGIMSPVHDSMRRPPPPPPRG